MSDEAVMVGPEDMDDQDTIQTLSDSSGSREMSFMAEGDNSRRKGEVDNEDEDEGEEGEDEEEEGEDEEEEGEDEEEEGDDEEEEGEGEEEEVEDEDEEDNDDEEDEDDEDDADDKDEEREQAQLNASEGDEKTQGIAEAASRAGAELEGAVQDLSNKIIEGVSGFAKGTPGLGNLGSTLSSWWSTLDTPIECKKDRTTETSGSTSGVAPAASTEKDDDGLDLEELQREFSLDKSEALMESFHCKMMQTYRCYHNSYTPDVQLKFEGKLYITDKRSAFSIKEQGRNINFTIEHTDVMRVEKQRVRQRGQAEEFIRLQKDDGDHIIWRDFAAEEIDSALGLLEHLTGE